MYRLIDYGSMLRDRRRIDAYRRALAASIVPSTVVLELGAGVGTFGILACKLGAARVYAVDSADVIMVAEEIARANGVADRMHFIQARASDVELPERADLIVSDLGGALPLFEEHIPAVIHAREHLLKPGGALVPQRDRLFCAPLSSRELYASILAPWTSVDDVDFTAAETMALHTPHALPVEPQHLAAEPRCWAELDYATIDSPHVRGAVAWQMTAPHVIHGVALWFESTLHGDVVYSSGPWSSGSVHATMVLPLLEPLEIGAGETFRFTLEATLVAGRYVTTWQAGEGARQSSFLAEPRSGESLAARAEDALADTDIAGDATFHISDRVLSRPVGDEVLLLHLSSGVYHVLNETAARIWRLIENGNAIASIANAIAAEFDVDPASAAADVRALVGSLEEERLISR
jgi:protein arginine N-methyltransferase 1